MNHRVRHTAAIHPFIDNFPLLLIMALIQYKLFSNEVCARVQNTAGLSKNCFFFKSKLRPVSVAFVFD
jgi:hypothetical protein